MRSVGESKQSWGEGGQLLAERPHVAVNTCGQCGTARASGAAIAAVDAR